MLARLKTPVFNAERYRPKDETNPEAGFLLRVDGLVRNPRVLTLPEIKEMPRSRADTRLTSVSGFSVRAGWEGVSWADFLGSCGPEEAASHATFYSAGGERTVYTTTVSLEDLAKPRVLLVHSVEGEPLEWQYGGPLRLLVPHLWGYKSCKWLARVEFTDQMRGGFWEDRGYPREAEIEPGWTLDVNSRTRRRIEGGEVTGF